jgi:hypothetical protein
VDGKIHCVKWILSNYSLGEGEFEADQWNFDAFCHTEQTDYAALVNCFELHKEWKVLQKMQPNLTDNELEILKWQNNIKRINDVLVPRLLEVAQSPTFGTLHLKYQYASELDIIRSIYVPHVILTAHSVLYANHTFIPG